METKIRETLMELREYGMAKKAKFSLLWQYEKSSFIRYANSGISLNTGEDLNRLYITVYGDHRKAETSLIFDPADLDTVKQMFDKALQMLEFAGELSYQPTLFAGEGYTDKRGYDRELAEMSKDEMIDFVDQAVLGLETEDIVLSGNFSTGETMLGHMTSLSAEIGFWAATDAQVTLVLSSQKDKWEVNAEQSAVRRADFDADVLHKQLNFMVDAYLSSEPIKLPLGKYKVVLGPAATAEYLSLMAYIGIDGDSVMRGPGMHTKSDLGKKIFSNKFSLYDDPDAVETFAFSHDLTGKKRSRLPFYEHGVFSNFEISQSLADEFGLVPNAMDIPHLNMAMTGGDWDIKDIGELKSAAEEKDILYIPYLHYTGVVNPGEGLVTGSSRFGALLFKQDGSIEVPYNVRLTNKLSDLFGASLKSLSKETVAYNLSQTYGARNPEAAIVPGFVCLDDIEISHSNDSY